MASLTVRNISDHLLSSLRILSVRERRSLNNEFLVILEEGLAARTECSELSPPGGALQAELWLDLCGRWQDDRETAEIIEDIRSKRSAGRAVLL
jgi:plasmid stability protein